MVMTVSPNTIDSPLPVVIRAAGVDCWSEVRGLHALCIRSLSDSAIETSEALAFTGWIHSPDYTAALMQHDVQTAWYDGLLVGTAGWVPSDDAGTSARITAVFVSPLFTRLGIGRQVVAAAEARARAGGFHNFATRAFPTSVGFFEALGYFRSSQGVHPMGTDNGIPVTFMRKTDALAKGNDEIEADTDLGGG